MKMCLELKLSQYPEFVAELLKTGNAVIIEDCTTHDRESVRYWGMVNKNGTWLGENNFGMLWMEIRTELQTQTKNINQSSTTTK